MSCEGGRGLCYFIPLLSETPLTASPLEMPLDYSPLGVSYDPVERRIYWTDSYGNVNRALLDGTSTEVIIRGHWNLMGIEVDPVGRKIYYADEYANKIRVSTLDGSSQATLVNVDSPQGIVLDSSEG